MSDSLVEFLQKKGAIDVLCVMGRHPRGGIGNRSSQDGSTFTDLLESTRVSRRTLSKRLKEGAKPHRLWGPFSFTDPRGTTYQRYVLQPRGKKLQQIIVDHRLPDMLAETRANEEAYERQCEAVIDRLKDNSVDELVRGSEG